ncbi:MAG: DUF1295 domain-containing protein [Nitrospirales bacterium]
MPQCIRPRGPDPPIFAGGGQTWRASGVWERWNRAENENNVPLAVGLSWAWAALAWPLVMMVSLLWITGVPLAEAQALSTRGDAYRAYQRTTNRIFPWLPRQN